MSDILKSALITQLGKKLMHIPEEDIASSINIILEQMSNILSHGGRIEIRDFGTFSLHYHLPRKAHNPKSGKKIVTSAKYAPHFKPGKELRERVNAAYQEKQ